MSKSSKKTSLPFNGQANKGFELCDFDCDYDSRSEFSIFFLLDIREVDNQDPLKSVFLGGGHVLYLHDFDTGLDCIRPANETGMRLSQRHMFIKPTSPLRLMAVSGYNIKKLTDITDEEWVQLNKPSLRTDVMLNNFERECVISIIRLVCAGPLPYFSPSLPQFLH